MKKLLFIIISVVCCVMSHAQRTLTLEQILDSARTNNIAIRNGQRSMEAAVQQRKEAFTKYFPTVSGSSAWFTANKPLLSVDLSPLSMPVTMGILKGGTFASVTAIQPVFAGGQIVNGNRLAKIGEDVARLQLQLSMNEVEQQVEYYYWQIVSLEEKRRTVEVVEALLSDIYKDVDAAVRAGVALRNDLLQVQIRQNETKSQKLKVENGLSLVRMLLSQYAGISDTSFIVAPIEMTDYKNPTGILTESDKYNYLQQLPEYQLLQSQVQAATLQKKITVGQNLPTFAVGADYSYSHLTASGGMQGSSLIGNNQSNAMLFATLRIPVSDWWGGSHAIKRKKIEHQNAVEELADKSELLMIRMQKSWNDVVESYQQLSIAQQSISQADENLRHQRNYYRAGTATMSDLLEAQMLYQQTLDSRTDAYADYQNKLLAYRHATGQ